MTEVAAPVWNQIAESQQLESKAAQIAFKLDQDQLAEVDRLLMIRLEDLQTPQAVARCLPTYLPLLTESQAISQFVSQHPTYRNALPEVNSPKEAVELATVDYRLTPEEQSLL